MTSSGWAPIGGEHLNKPAIPADEPRVFLALPIYGGIEAEFFATLLQCLQRMKSRVQVLQGDSLVCRSRNNLVHEFRKNAKAPFLLFLDTDLILDPVGLEHLVNLPPEFAVVGGCYPKKKTGPAEWVCNPIPNTQPDANGLQEVWEMGTGMLRVHRSVFEAIASSYPQLHYTCDGNHDARVDFFPVGTWPDARAAGAVRYLSEDWYLCQLARAVGFKIWADTKCAARHIGRVAYPFPEPEAPAPGSGNASPSSSGSGEERRDGANAPSASGPAIPNRQSPIGNSASCPSSANSAGVPDSAPWPIFSPGPAPRPSANSAGVPAPPPSQAPISFGSPPPSSSSEPLAGPRPTTSSARSAGKTKKSRGRGRTRKTAATSQASR